MPELPEVETIARQLDKVVTGKKIQEVEVLRRVSFLGDPEELRGKIIERVDRHAKMIVWHIKDWEKLMVTHLKMTGQLVYRQGKKQVVGGHPSEDWTASLPNNHTRVVVTFEDEGKLFFNDLRVFGWMKIVTKDWLEEMLKKAPPDVVEKRFSEEYFGGILKRSKKAIKLVLMDQEKIGGVGNIYANDALNLARIDPKRSAASLSDDETKKLYEAVKEVIDLGIKYGGATYSDYKDAQGLGGKYQEHFLVYGREGEMCRNCGGEIEKIKMGGRGTYFCPGCQK